MKRYSTKSSEAALPVLTGLSCALTLVFGFWLLDSSLSERAILSVTHKTPGLRMSIVFFLLLGGALAALWTRDLQRYQNEQEEGGLKRVLLHCLAVLGPGIFFAAWCKPIFSVDVFYYVINARQMTIHGMFPFEVPPKDVLFDPIVAQVPRFWFAMTAPYGPLALGLFCVPGLFLSAPGLFAHTTAMKLFWALFYLAFGGLCFLYFRGKDRLAKSLGLLASPALLWFCLLDGHVDVLLLFFLPLVLFTLRDKGPLWNGLALCAAACIKIVPVVCLPVCFFWWLRRSWKDALKFSVAFSTVYVAVYLPLKGAEIPAVLRWTEAWNDYNYASLVTRLLYSMNLSVPTIRSSANLIFFASVGLICFFVWKGTFEKKPGVALGLCLMALFLTRSYYQPWHTLWFWPFFWMEAQDDRTYYFSLIAWTLPMVFTFYVGLNIASWPIGLAALANAWILLKNLHN